MTATATTLLARQGAELAFALEIEGVDKVFFTRTEISSLWSATDWTSYHYGLDLPDGISRSIDFLTFQPQWPSVTFRIVDTDRTLADLFKNRPAAATHWTNITASVDRDDTTITVKSTSGFDASGTAYIGHEAFTYSGTTATTFTGCTRGKWPFGGKTSWAHTFRMMAGAGVDTAYGTEVTSAPIVWKGRGVTCYMLAYDYQTKAWCSRADAVTWFAGTIDGLSYDGETNTWAMDCTSIERRLSLQLLRDQYVGTVEGFVLPADEMVSVMEWADAVTTVAYPVIPAGTYTAATLAEKLTELLEDETTATNLTFHWNLDLLTDGHCRVMARVPSPVTTITYRCALAAVNTSASYVLRALGLDSFGQYFAVDDVDGAADVLTFRKLGPTTAVKAWLHLGGRPTFTVVHRAGAWLEQPADEMPAHLTGSPTGYLHFGENEWFAAVSHDGNNVFTQRGACTLAGQFSTTASYTDDVIYYGDQRNLDVRQVWVSVGGTLIRSLLRMLMSTGTVDYNAMGWDKWPAQMSFGIPSTLINEGAFRSLAGTIGSMQRVPFILTEPTSALDLITGLCATLGFCIGWRDGKLAPFTPTTPTAGETADWMVGSDQIIGHTQTDDGNDLKRNRLTVNYNQDPISGEYQTRETYDYMPAQDADEEPVAFEIDAQFLRGSPGESPITDWRANVAAPLIAHFSSGLRRARLTVSRECMGITAGDVIDLTDDEIPASDGGYGV